MTLFIGLCLGSYLLETVGQHFVMERIDFKKSSKELGLAAKEILTPEGILASFDYEQSLPFYTKRRVVVVGEKGELEFGSLRGDQTEWFIDEARFLKLWSGDRQVVSVIKIREYERLAPVLAPPATILVRKGKKLLISNRIPLNKAPNPVP